MITRGKKRITLLKLLLLVNIFLSLSSIAAAEEEKSRILILGLKVTARSYKLFSNVIEARLRRDFLASGNAEVISTEEKYEILNRMEIKPYTINTREVAVKVAKEAGADFVLYGNIERTYLIYDFTISLVRVSPEINELTKEGRLEEWHGPAEVAEITAKISRAFVKIIPEAKISSPERKRMPVQREEAVPDTMLTRFKMEDVTDPGERGPLEVIMNHFKVFPAPEKWNRLLLGEDMTTLFDFLRIQKRESNPSLAMLQKFGEFAEENGMEAYMLKNCNIKALYSILSLNIPILIIYRDNIRIFTGFNGLPDNVNSYFSLDRGEILPLNEISEKDIIANLFVVNPPGRYRGHSREKLVATISRFPDTWKQFPSLLDFEAINREPVEAPQSRFGDF